MTVRLLNPAPAVYDIGQVRALAQSRFGSALLDCNEVRESGTQIAVYLPSTPNGAKATAWTNDLATYTLAHPTATELAANQAGLRDKAAAALVANIAFLNTAKPGTAAAQASVAYDQVRALTRQVNAIIKLSITEDFADTTGT